MAEAQLTNQLTRIDSMTNVELRAELKRRGCPTSGNKKDLLAKLRVALQKEYEQPSVTTNDSRNTEARQSSRSSLQQSPASVRSSANRSSLDNSTASSTSYMTPHESSSITYTELTPSAEVTPTPTDIGLRVEDQPLRHSTRAHSMKMQQNVQVESVPVAAVPEQLLMPPANDSQVHYESVAHQQQQELTPMTTRRGRASADDQLDLSTVPSASVSTPEKRTRTRSKKGSVDLQQNEIPPAAPPEDINCSAANTAVETINPIATAQTNDLEQPAVKAATNDDHHDDVGVNLCVSKNSEEEQRDVENIRSEREDSRSPSVGSSSAKSESVIKEIPLSGERHRLSRSKSPKSRWHHSPSPQQQTNQSAAIDEELSADSTPTNENDTATHEKIENAVPMAPVVEEDKMEKITDESSTTTSQEAETKAEVVSDDNQQPEKPAPQQQLKVSRSQVSSMISSSLMKGLNRSAASNKVNLSSDVLKTLIPDISLAPESVINDELEASISERDQVDEVENSLSQPILDTGVGSSLRLSDSMTIGELADQKQQRNRTVVIDVTVDSSSLNDELSATASDSRKKPQTPSTPLRVASFESKPLLDGKTNALMMDEPVRVKDATAAMEPPSRILYIRGLTRPFTLPLLKELLGRYGKLVEGEFWLDKIKSQCFVIYNTLDEAQNAREGLDGCRWPSTNPKTLTVRFGRQDEFEFSRKSDLPPDKMLTDAMDTGNNRLVQEKPAPTNKVSTTSRRSISPTDETKAIKKSRPAGNADVREWDLPKLQEEKEKSPIDRNLVEESKVKVNETPAKGLDDYFRKTKAKPAIYWLPLTEEQVIEGLRQQQVRAAEREEEKRKRELEENARAPNNNRDPKSRTNVSDPKSSDRTRRRSPSPREKRRRMSSSSPPRSRENKRH